MASWNDAIASDEQPVLVAGNHVNFDQIGSGAKDGRLRCLREHRDGTGRREREEQVSQSQPRLTSEFRQSGFRVGERRLEPDRFTILCDCAPGIARGFGYLRQAEVHPRGTIAHPQE